MIVSNYTSQKCPKCGFSIYGAGPFCDCVIKEKKCKWCGSPKSSPDPICFGCDLGQYK